MSIPGQIPAGNRLKREFYLINQIPPGQDGERQDMNKDGFILDGSTYCFRIEWLIPILIMLNFLPSKMKLI